MSEAIISRRGFNEGDKVKTRLYQELILSNQKGMFIPITIGAGGHYGDSSIIVDTGNSGGTASFDTYLSANGGSGGGGESGPYGGDYIGDGGGGGGYRGGYGHGGRAGSNGTNGCCVLWYYVLEE